LVHLDSSHSTGTLSRSPPGFESHSFRCDLVPTNSCGDPETRKSMQFPKQIRLTPDRSIGTLMSVREGSYLRVEGNRASSQPNAGSGFMGTV
jgi:hypothetical protein